MGRETQNANFDDKLTSKLKNLTRFKVLQMGADGVPSNSYVLSPAPVLSRNDVDVVIEALGVS